jgi:hypothetical protein
VPALSEYAAAASRQHTVFQPPSDLGSWVRWAFIALAAFIALRLVMGALGISRRR